MRAQPGRRKAIALEKIASHRSLASFMQNHYEPSGNSARYLLLLGRDQYIRAILVQKNLKFKEVLLKKGYILEDIKDGQ